MAAEFTAEEIMEIAGARLAAGMMPDDTPAAVHVDTREMPEGAWFIALPGAQYDGHDFLGDAFSQGAVGCIVAERPSYPIASTSFPLLAVDDTEKALTALARNWRRRLSPRILMIVVNRSNEADGTAAICLEQLKKKYRTDHWQLTGQSLHMVLNTVLRLSEETQAVVLEVSPTSFDYLAVCLEALLPNVVALSNSGLDNLRLALTPADFLVGLHNCIEKADVKKTKLVVAGADAGTEAICAQFKGSKVLSANLFLSGQEPEGWAAAEALKLL